MVPSATMPSPAAAVAAAPYVGDDQDEFHHARESRMTLPTSRRRALETIAVTGTGLLLPRRLLARDTGGLIRGADVCLLTPEVTQGPYYLDERLVRSDIGEGRPGVPLAVRLQVVDAACAPLADARVDVWHCDAQGVYSSFGGAERGQSSQPGETFLRGTQMTDRRGIVGFATIYPGWYRGRTTHIHFKVLMAEAGVLTGQLFFPDALSAYLYANVPAYARGAARDTLNAGDGIARQATHASFAAITEERTEYLAELIVGVDPRARSTEPGRPPGPPPRPPGGGRAAGGTALDLVPGPANGGN